MAEEQLVVFRLGKEEYGVPISQVREIILYKNTTKVPNAPKFLDGIINLRGHIIPVIELSSRFNMEASNIAEKNIIIIEIDGQDLGAVVDCVSEVLRIPDSCVDTAPNVAIANNEFIVGVAKHDNRLIIVLDLRKLLDQNEIALLQSVN